MRLLCRIWLCGGCEELVTETEELGAVLSIFTAVPEEAELTLPAASTALKYTVLFLSALHEPYAPELLL